VKHHRRWDHQDRLEGTGGQAHHSRSKIAKSSSLSQRRSLFIDTEEQN
jgi:hypothetical protein